MKKIILLPCFIVLLAINFLNAQVITGKVTDLYEDEEPLPFANIIVKGTTKGVVSDFNGNYEIEVDKTDKALVFSFLGYETQEIEIKDQTIVDINLKAISIALDEVVIVGYGTQKCGHTYYCYTSCCSVDVDSCSMDTDETVSKKIKDKNNGCVFYPNPTTGVLNMKNIEDVNKLFIYDMSGRMLEKIMVNNQKLFNIDISHFPKGMYLISYLNKGERITKKIVLK